MTTITVEIDRANDLSALEEFIGRLGLKYHVKEQGGLVYTDELKSMLDGRYADYLKGNVNLVDAEESKKRIQELLAGGGE
jgi:hypothetical protein